jgi:hypothetical protein
VIYQDNEFGFSLEASRENLRNLEARRRKIMEYQEATWRLKSRAIWLANGDENTKLFHAFSKGLKVVNIIWSLKDQEDRLVTPLKG